MTKCIYKQNFSLHQLPSDVIEDFKKDLCERISDFNAFCIRLIGDVLRQPSSQYFWKDGKFMWFTDAKQNHVQAVWMTNNGNAIFEDEKTGEISRVEFHY